MCILIMNRLRLTYSLIIGIEIHIGSVILSLILIIFEVMFLKENNSSWYGKCDHKYSTKHPTIFSDELLFDLVGCNIAFKNYLWDPLRLNALDPSSQILSILINKNHLETGIVNALNTDDTKLCHDANSEQVWIALQGDLDKLVNWFDNRKWISMLTNFPDAHWITI